MWISIENESEKKIVLWECELWLFPLGLSGAVPKVNWHTNNLNRKENKTIFAKMESPWFFGWLFVVVHQLLPVCCAGAIGDYVCNSVLKLKKWARTITHCREKNPGIFDECLNCLSMAWNPPYVYTYLGLAFSPCSISEASIDCWSSFYLLERCVFLHQITVH